MIKMLLELNENTGNENQCERTQLKQLTCEIFSFKDDLSIPLHVSSPSNLTYVNFFQNFLLKNRPCLFTEDITSDWPSRTDFIIVRNTKLTKPEDTKINFQFLKDTYGKANVTVTNCSNDKSVMDYGGGDTEVMTVHEFIDYWERYVNEGYTSTMPCLYLKCTLNKINIIDRTWSYPNPHFRMSVRAIDWHIMKETVNYIPYKTPVYFQSDWLNEAWDDKKDANDDFRFAYLGPQGTWTPFHCDVYGSFSWSANIIGTKKWYIYPPGKEDIFRGKTGQLIFDFNKPGKKDVDYYEIIQEAGQIIFVPSGWHHIVWNLTDVISINHNWMNSCNIVYVWITLKKALEDVKEEIKDLGSIPEFAEQCQLILKANHGMDYEMFFDSIEFILAKRKEEIYFPKGLLGPNHIRFDIAAIENVLENHIMKDSDAVSIICSKGRWPTLLQVNEIENPNNAMKMH